MATKKRTTKTQFKVFIDFIKTNPILRIGRFAGPKEAPADLEEIWGRLRDSLNACGDGPVRSELEWKKVFTEWKCATRKKKRENKELNELEKMLIQLTGPAAVEGLQVEEIGLNETEVPMIEDQENDDDVTETITIHTQDCAEDEPNNNTSQAGGTANKKRVRKTTGDILTDAYVKAITSQKDGLMEISVGLKDIAVAINRFCDIFSKAHNIKE